MIRKSVRLALLAAAVVVSTAAVADEAAIQRGKYLATIGGCNACHTPGYFFGNPTSRVFSAARMWDSKSLG